MVVGKRKAQLADGSIIQCDVVTSVEVRFKNRQTTCRAMILPGNTEPLFGAIRTEDMDLIVSPHLRVKDYPEHPYYAQVSLK